MGLQNYSSKMVVSFHFKPRMCDLYICMNLEAILDTNVRKENKLVARILCRDFVSFSAGSID